MELNNPKEIIEQLVQMFKNESKENPIKIKNFYYCLSQLKYIVFLADDGEIYWRKDNYKTNDERIGATLFVDENVFNQWKGSRNINYMIIDFNGLVSLLRNVYTANNTSVIITTLLTWDDSPLTFQLDIDDIKEFQNYVLMYNAISTQKSYIVGAPSNKQPELLNLLKNEFGKLDLIKSAYFVQILTPPQNNENIIESHKPNTSYFTIVYDTFEDKFSFARCFEIQDRCMQIAKEMNIDLLVVHKDSEVGRNTAANAENEFYKV